MTSNPPPEDLAPVAVIETVARITVIGSSLGVYLTKDLRKMGLDQGDHVKIRLERI